MERVGNGVEANLAGRLRIPQNLIFIEKNRVKIQLKNENKEENMIIRTLPRDQYPLP